MWTGFRNIQFRSTSNAVIITKFKRKWRQRITDKFLFTFKNKYYYHYSIDDNPEVVENTIIGTNAINGVELDYDVLLGDVAHTSNPADAGDTGIDNIIEQFAGSLATWDATTSTIDYSTTWSSRGKSEAKPLLQIIKDEITYQNSRPKQLVQMSLIETGSGVSTIDVQANYMDDLNQHLGNTRKFIFNRGSFDTKFRRWMIDMIEVFEIVPDAPSLLSLTVISTSRIDLVCSDNSSNEAGFSIERSTDGITYSEIDTVTAGTEAYSDTTCSPGTLYYYRVRAYKGTAYSSYTNIESATTFSMGINHIDAISAQDEEVLFYPQPSFEAVSAGVVTGVTIYWQIRRSNHIVINSGSEVFNFINGTQTKSFSGIMTPTAGVDFDFQIGRTSVMEFTSNHFSVGGA
jgi:hypothetical protein